ncbi:SDR family NAD(P)-dependent oxidoreductase [Azospirillum agricola]|uniref:SDR family NAD(P)-dependent oxidoreductase n=1 Tax=Azospirillum agricola TaxID=1720247 RepID=UPI000A0F246A|nr:SDR family NAD(P)-dependent oxidoreductase [Azospirillum agricola]SMH61370.1 NAD(P)-dependent dehydrogenase, short-chain alcohol dehydrogenase family [Azospirillum lipoferum]
MDLALAGKVVLVTGGSKGLGLAAARAFAREGSRVVIASRSPENLAAAQAALAADGLEVATVAADFADAAEAAGAVAEAERPFGPVEVLINSAGAATRTPAEELDAAAWKAGLDAKFFPYIHAQDAVLKSFRRRAGADARTETRLPPSRQIGAIVNIVGTGGRIPSGTHLPGGSANAALLLSTLGLAREYAPYGIRINAINPGFTLTDRIEQNLALEAKRLGIGRDEALAAGAAATPLRRYGEAHEIAEVALFLASERASYVVGALVAVDGGQSLAL